MLLANGWLACLLLAAACVDAYRPRPSILRRRNPSYAALSDPGLSSLLSSASTSTTDAHLDLSNPASSLSRFLVPRAPGTANLTRVHDMLRTHFAKLGWHLETDQFSTSTPIGDKTFTNLVFTHDPNAKRRLALAAHTDSKYFATHPADQFIGATDSAAPCVMLMDVAEALTPWLDQRRERVAALGGEEGHDGQGETLQIIFFDGEEAFNVWTHDDSIYGAKHLAEKWSHPSASPTTPSLANLTPLQRLSHLVLFDLLGAPAPVIRSYFAPTGWFFDEFVHSEQRLKDASLLYAAGTATKSSFFVHRQPGAQMNLGGIEDDHLPFLAKGVPIVHMIPLPFPHVWHTIRDDASALDMPTVKAWCLLIRLTVAEYLGLEPPEMRTKRDELSQ